MIVGTEDMVLLPKSNDASITENLKLRLSSSEIYTNIGHVLVAAKSIQMAGDLRRGVCEEVCASAAR